MKKRFIFLLILISAIAVLFFVRSRTSHTEQVSTAREQNPERIIINGKTITVEIANTPTERQLGLGGRESLKPGTGLLFIFDTADYHSFWMKDMNFSIDIFWLDENYQIVDSWLGADPASFPKSVTPETKAKYILETNPGEIR